MQPAADVTSIAGETSQRIRDAIKKLKSGERELIVLHYLEERPIAELSKLLGISRNTVDVRLHRARKRLKGFLEDERP